MSNEDEISRRLLAAARIDIAPRITDDSDPRVAPTRFLEKLIELIRDEFENRLPRDASFDERNRVLGTVCLSLERREDLLSGIRVESERLRDFGVRQRITALVDFSVRDLIEAHPAGARAAVSSADRRIDEDLMSNAPPNNGPALRPAPLGGDPLVNALARFASGGLRLLRGYIGASEVAGYRRLYSSLELTDYLDIPIDAIVRTVDLRTIANPLGGAAVWIRVGAEVYRGRINAAKMEIQGNFLRGAAGGWGGRGEEWTGPRGEEWTGPRGEEWTGPRGEEWTGPRG